MSSNGKTLPTVIALVLILAAAALIYVERTVPRAGAVTAIQFHTAALASGNLTDLKNSASNEVFLTYQSQASRPVLAELNVLFNEKIPRLAEPTWREIRDRARAAAGQEYEALRSTVVSLGRRHFQQLPPDERSRLIDLGNFDRFIFVSGAGLLPDDEKRRFPDPGAYYSRRDKRDYMAREAWRHVSDEEREQLGTSAALADELTFQKLLYFDKVAAPLLTPEERQTLETYDRESIQSLERFVSVHGERLLGETLAASPPTWLTVLPVDCASPAFAIGSLLHGPMADCELRGRDPGFQVSRGRFDWLVVGVKDFTVASTGSR